VTASKIACAASSKYLDLAGDGFAAGHLPRCSMLGHHRLPCRSSSHAWTSPRLSLCSPVVCIEAGLGLYSSRGTKILHWTFCIGDLQLSKLVISTELRPDDNSGGPLDSAGYLFSLLEEGALSFFVTPHTNDCCMPAERAYEDLWEDGPCHRRWMCE
jgi:hypothetical protein